MKPEATRTGPPGSSGHLDAKQNTARKLYFQTLSLNLGILFDNNTVTTYILPIVLQLPVIYILLLRCQIFYKRKSYIKEGEAKASKGKLNEVKEIRCKRVAKK